MKILKVARRGNILAVALPEGLRETLESEFTYNRTRRLVGPAARIARLEGRSHFVSDPVACFRYETGGRYRFVFRLGLYERFRNLVRGFGYESQLLPWKSPRPSNVFQPDWDAVRRVVPEFRPRQQELLEMMVTHECGRIDCPTGWGKTTMICLAPHLFPNARIAVVMPGKRACKAIWTELSRTVPDVGLVGAGKNRPGDRVTVYSPDSLGHSHFTEDLVIGDECETLAAVRRSRYMGRFTLARMFGLSGSHLRGDGSLLQLEQMFGPIRMTITDEEAVGYGAIVQRKVFWVSTPRSVIGNPGATLTNDTAKDRAKIWRNQPRNRIVARAAKLLYDEGHQVLVSVRTIDHLYHLRAFLPEFEIIHAVGRPTAEEFEWYVQRKLLRPDEPRLTDMRYYEIEREFKNGNLRGVIANSVWDAALDFKQLSVVVRADASASPRLSIQIPGRSSRTHEASGKSYAIIVDFLDEFDKGLCQRRKKRQNHYAAQKWKQVLPEGFVEPDYSRHSDDVLTQGVFFDE